MKIVYIAHPIRDDILGNLEKIRLIVRDINLKHPDVVPFAPYWLDCQALDDNDPEQRQRGIKNSMVLIERCVTEMWLYGDRISNGMWAEIELAVSMLTPVYPKTKETYEEFIKKYVAIKTK